MGLLFAESAYRTALGLDPEDARSAYPLARLLARRGVLEESLALCARAAELATHHAPAHWRRGLWHLELGQLAEHPREGHLRHLYGSALRELEQRVERLLAADAPLPLAREPR